MVRVLLMLQSTGVFALLNTYWSVVTRVKFYSDPEGVTRNCVKNFYIQVGLTPH